jgi:hypothetical protein
MKPKILLAKYLDWAVLAILAIVLLIVAIKALRLRASGEEKLRDEINQYEQAVQKGMSDTSARPLPPHDYLGEIQNRFEHPPVLDPYRHNPFLTRTDIASPPLQLVMGIPHMVTFLGTRFTQVLAGDEKLVHVDLAYDLLTGVSTVTFTPLAMGEVGIRIQTDDDLVHLFKIAVRTLVTPPPPNPPPADVAVIPSAAVQFKNIVKPAMVLIYFTPNNPEQPTPTVGFSTNAAVYRKPAGASDAEYERLDDPDQPLVPLDHDAIHAIWLKFQPPEVPVIAPEPTAEPTTPTATTATTTPTTPTGALMPEAVTGIRPFSLSAAPQAAEPPPNSFVFLDQTVDDGETYIYKIVTLSTATDEPDIEPVPCEAPYVSPRIYLPPIVDFRVRTITADSATVRITRRDPDTGEWLPPQDFTVGLGQKIGGMRSLKFMLPPDQQVLGLPTRYVNRDVDFSTGCILVNVLPDFQTMEYDKLRYQRATDPYSPVVYKAKDTREPQILYLTPGGALRFKPKEKEATPLFPSSPPGGALRFGPGAK